MLDENNNSVTRYILSCLYILFFLKGWIQFLSDIPEGMLLPTWNKTVCLVSFMYNADGINRRVLTYTAKVTGLGG